MTLVRKYSLYLIRTLLFILSVEILNIILHGNWREMHNSKVFFILSKQYHTIYIDNFVNAGLITFYEQKWYKFNRKMIETEFKEYCGKRLKYVRQSKGMAFVPCKRGLYNAEERVRNPTHCPWQMQLLLPVEFGLRTRFFGFSSILAWCFCYRTSSVIFLTCTCTLQFYISPGYILFVVCPSRISTHSVSIIFSAL